MHMTSHAATLWSTTPPPAVPAPAQDRTTDPDTDTDTDTVPVTVGAEGPATVATYSTTYGREGPEWTALICDLPDGTRTYARLDGPAGADDDLVDAAVTLEAGARGVVTAHR
jgi:hypothetical protein